MAMKLQFDPNLKYQESAINAIVRLFDGQQKIKSTFSIPKILLEGKQNDQLSLDYGSYTDAVGNKITLSSAQILDNLRTIQLENGLPQSKNLQENGYNFTVEMETGTGKTYVYLRSVMELHKNYGFTKFIIVVPSIAIKEGVYKSLQITEEHFKKHFDNIPYEYFVYNSDNLSQVHTFATSDDIQIMVINIDAFRKSFDDPEKISKSNRIHRHHDKLPDDAKPIDLIKATNPVVIIDEPQSVDNTKKSKEAIASLNPLCVLRYSATHRELHHQVYKLDAIDAYEQQLVKAIEVAGVSVSNAKNEAYIRVVSLKASPRNAKVELDVLEGGKVVRKTKTVKPGDDLEDVAKRDIYRGYMIDDIYVDETSGYINFTGNDKVIHKDQAVGSVVEDEVKRVQIHRTITEHLDKELRLRPSGIKVLSLFFIDRVANYRIYDDEGNQQKGKYALMFEEEFKKVIVKNAKYHTLLDMATLDRYASDIHDGYFSIDKKSRMVEGDETNESNKANAERGYNLIMKEKEKLLGFDCPVKFIFSHSALKEGWDNPNVFQICTLREAGTEIERRQKIGRGLRICVNQSGERIYGPETNTLTVIANESYEDFCRGLQHDLETEAGIAFGTVQKHAFASIVVSKEDGIPRYLGEEVSDKMYAFLEKQGYIDKKGKVQDTLRTELKNQTLKLPEDLAPYTSEILTVLKKIAGDLNIGNADKKKQKIRVNTVVLDSPEFKALWEKIKYKTTFSVDFDNDRLISLCIDEIKAMPKVQNIKILYHKGKAHITSAGVGSSGVTERKIHSASSETETAPDILSYLQNETYLKRQTLADILLKSGRMGDFKENPQVFIEAVASIIKEKKQECIIDGIMYEKIGADSFYDQKLFTEEEFQGYLDKNMIKVSKSPLEYVLYDSNVEKEFAQGFESTSQVKVFTKLPTRFKIKTPLGNYSPDWAVLLEDNGQEKLYFIVETKGNTKAMSLRGEENVKINCGEEHFKALNTGVSFRKEKDYEQFISDVL